MCGKSLTKNLQAYLLGLSAIDIPIVKFDVNQEKVLPSIVVGFDSETTSFPGGFGHYTVNGFTNICIQGYEDSNNDSADTYAQVIVDALLDETALLASVNKPLSGTDVRPVTAFCLNGLFIRSADRTIEGTSAEIEIKFDAFCAAKA
jgi:hypothetical protein